MEVTDRIHAYAFSYVESGLLPKGNEEWHLTALVKRIANLVVGIPLWIASIPVKLGGDFVSWIAPKTAFERAMINNRDWEEVDTSTHELAKVAPNDFKWGVASCDYQYLGGERCPNSQWAHFHPSQMAFDMWGREDEVIAKLREMGLNSFRFSVEWSLIEPEEGRIDRIALQRYVNFARKLRAAGIDPMVTLHHFSEPKWFADKGSFSKPENTGHFCSFSRLVAGALKDHVKTWCTINEPGIFAFMGHIMGEYPPAHTADFAGAGEVIKNLLLAHCAVYDIIKEEDAGASVGISHQALRFLPYSNVNLVARVAADRLTRAIHDPVVEFFETGEFNYQVPFMANVTARVENVREKLDWFGLQCYARPLLGGMPWDMASTHYEGEEMTDMEFRSDPGAIYAALKDVRRVGKPVIITENGIPTIHDDKRKRYMERAMHAVAQAMKEGVDVRGYHAWSLTKNIEWHLGGGAEAPDFGLCYQDSLRVKPGARCFVDEVHAFHNRAVVPLTA